MPITFIEIERQKSWRIISFLFVLILLYFALSLTVAYSFLQLFSFGFTSPGSIFQRPSVLIVVSVFSLLTATIHFLFSSLNAIEAIRHNLGAIDPDPDDMIHAQLMNIVNEIHIASGRRTGIRCLVIPSLSVNALSAVDLRGNAIIAVTEGLLSRTTRAQLEAVVAHEAYHILSGDCRETTVAASLFGIPSAAMEKVITASEGRVLLSPWFLVTWILAWLLVKAGYLLNMFISREREYRADAGAVRMTRNPLALAEVLYMLSRHWNGTGSIGAGLEMLCITGTSDRLPDESEGWIADLMSTHPPLRKRISILLQMAHSGISELKKAAAPALEQADTTDLPDTSFYALDSKYQWQGPFSLLELAALPWLAADSWISSNDSSIVKASSLSEVDTLVSLRYAQDERNASDYRCPSCHQPLRALTYEKTRIFQCRFCGGSLVDDVKLPRIIVRKEIKYSQRIRDLSKYVLSENQLRAAARYKGKAASLPTDLLNCPKCGNRMNRSFYSMAYLVELDRCSYCRISWFDNDELEMLQCMIDHKMASATSPQADTFSPLSS